MIDQRFIEARRKAARLEHPHLEYPAYVRKGTAQLVHELANDPTLPIAGPVRQPAPRIYSVDDVILAAVICVGIILLFIEV